jgi:hypothetical protein
MPTITIPYEPRPIWKKEIHIPLCWNAFYIQFIYKHLGKCHPDLRSKFYIGKARKINSKEENINENN